MHTKPRPNDNLMIVSVLWPCISPRKFAPSASTAQHYWPTFGEEIASLNEAESNEPYSKWRGHLFRSCAFKQGTFILIT